MIFCMCSPLQKRGAACFCYRTCAVVTHGSFDEGTIILVTICVNCSGDLDPPTGANHLGCSQWGCFEGTATPGRSPGCPVCRGLSMLWDPSFLGPSLWCIPEIRSRSRWWMAETSVWMGREGFLPEDASGDRPYILYRARSPGA